MEHHRTFAADVRFAQTSVSDPFFFQVVHVEPVMHHPVTRNELLNIILHVLLELQGQVAQMQVAFFVVPGNDFGTRTLFSMVVDPLDNLFVGCAGGNERPKIIITNLGKFQPALIERTVGMVSPSRPTSTARHLSTARAANT